MHYQLKYIVSVDRAKCVILHQDTAELNC